MEDHELATGRSRHIYAAAKLTTGGCPSLCPPTPVASSPGARDLIIRWLAGFLGVGSLVKRLDVGEGSYGIELEEETAVYDALGQVGGSWVWGVLGCCSCSVRPLDWRPRGLAPPVLAG